MAVAGTCLCSAVASATDKRSSLLAALESIRVEELKGHVEYLADDALEGREAGTRGGREAGDYLAAQLQRLGQSGAGVDGGSFQPFEPNFRNVLVRWEGGDPHLRNQYVVVGAHYDHIGYGTKKNSRGSVGQIHNGADDNASGASALLELAEALTLLPEPPKRSILLVFWDAEEKGMLGSKHWADHPTVPLEQIAAMLNVDMVGRLRQERLVVFGSRSAFGWRRLVSQGNEDPGLKLDFPWKMKANGDHWPFFDRGVPVLMFHTDVHEQYHRPGDDARLVNADGVRRVARLLLLVTWDLANRDVAPHFREAARREDNSAQQALLGPDPEIPDRLGIAWEPGEASTGGVGLTRVVAESAADKAGLKPGDRIVEFAGRPIRSGDELTWALAGARGPASMAVERAGHEQPLELTVQLNGDPLRLGVTWRVDDAEPGTVVLTGVIPGSPAAWAGLQPGDRIYQIAGRDFADDAQFAELAKTLPGPLNLLVERDGRVRTVEIQFEPEPLRRAA